MNITMKNKPRELFTISAGETFMYKGEIYIKLSENKEYVTEKKRLTFNATTNELHVLSEDCMIMKLDSELIIEGTT